MLSDRFGQKVADLVLSVTEQDKGLPWHERKKEALDHIKHFSYESLLVKSADVLSNVSELLDDYEREGEFVFTRFSVSKEIFIENQMKVITAIINHWAENPLSDDLLFIAKELQRVGSTSNMDCE